MNKTKIRQPAHLRLRLNAIEWLHYQPRCRCGGTTPQFLYLRTARRLGGLNWAGHCAEGFPTPRLFGVTVLTELQSGWQLTLWHAVKYKVMFEVLLLRIQASGMWMLADVSKDYRVFLLQGQAVRSLALQPFQKSIPVHQTEQPDVPGFN